MPHPVSTPPTPQCLNLSFNFPKITEQDLTELLTKKDTPFRLDVSNNYLTPQQLGIIAASMQASRAVVALIASCARIGPNFVEELSKIFTETSPLKVLDLNGNDIGPQGAKSLARYLPQARALEALILSYNKIKLEGGVTILQAIRDLPNLTILNLAGNDLPAGVAEHIALLLGEDSTLKELHLLANNLSSGGVKILQKLCANSTLSKLDLAHNNLCDDAGEVLVEVLKTNGVLRSLSIRDNKFSANVLKKIAEALEVNNSLSVLFIGGRGNEFDSSAFKALGKAIENNKTLKFLSLNGTTVQEHGTALALSLYNSSLETINLSFAGIRDQAATILAYSLREGSKQRFIIRDNPISRELQEIIDILTLPEAKHPDHSFFNFLFSNKKSQKSQKEKARNELKGLMKKLPFDILKKLQKDMPPEDHIEIDCSEEGPFMEYQPLLPQAHTLGEKAYSTFME